MTGCGDTHAYPGQSQDTNLNNRGLFLWVVLAGHEIPQLGGRRVLCGGIESFLGKVLIRAGEIKKLNLFKNLSPLLYSLLIYSLGSLEIIG